MDKRSLLFVLALTLTLFFVNSYFNREHEEKLRDWRKQQEQIEIKKAAEHKAQVEKRTVSPDALPIVDLFADRSGSKLIGAGVKTGESIIVLPWTSQAPQKIYARIHEDMEILSRDPSLEDGDTFWIYSTRAQETLQVADLQDQGNFDLQLVGLSNTGPRLTVSLGEYKDGKFSIPLEAPASDAIALMRTTKGFIPAGIFVADGERFLPLNMLKSTAVMKDIELPVTSTNEEEKFYVLENEYFQMVFSNVGGAITEINLPFSNKKNKSSMMREIEFDRTIKEKHSENAYFPMYAYYRAGEEEPSKRTLGNYYPLLRRDFKDARTGKTTRIPPSQYAFNTVHHNYPEIAELKYVVKHFEENLIEFETVQSYRRITKTYTLEKGETAPYVLNCSIKVEGGSRDLWITSGIPEVEIVSGSPSPILKYRHTKQGKSEVEKVSLPKDLNRESLVNPDWICNSNGFLGLIIDPLNGVGPGYEVEMVSGANSPTRLLQIGQKHNQFKSKDYPGYIMRLPVRTDGETMNFRFYAGPFADDTLAAVDTAFKDPATGYNPSYISCQSFHGWFSFISEPFAKLMLFCMKQFHKLTGSWAFSIFLLTALLRVLLYPLNAWSFKSMRRMQQIQPELQAIQARHKKDPKKAQMEQAKLFKDRGVNPISGCLPMLLQMPFLIGMFDLLKSTYELRGASFIPGWIDNLTSPDVLFSWETPIFFIGNEFHLLPLLLGGIMFLQQKMSSTLPKDKSQLTEQQQQQRMMGNMMTIVFSVMFYHFPSGLCIYWLSSSALAIAQQWFTNRNVDQTPVVVVDQPSKKGKGKKAKA